MNNKGFAITGIIYTLFILFLMILLSTLTGLSAYQRLMSNSISSLEDGIKETRIIEKGNQDITNMNTVGNRTAKYFGKYVFDLKEESATVVQCSAYLNAGDSFNDMFLSPHDCNNIQNKDNFELVKVYVFE